jgi:SAM-dependent methyltransferase
MYQAARLVYNRIPSLRRLVNRLFYQYLAGLDPHGEVTLMNYGYAELGPGAQPVDLDEKDEGDRYGLQMYHRVSGGVDLRGRDVLEVGSGRGGGAAYVKRRFSPRTMTGVDYCKEAVDFCQQHHAQDGLRYVHGDAEDLPFQDGVFDAVVNIESSHCYGDMARFLGEVRRVLRPGGCLLWADHREPHEIPALYDSIREIGFEVVREETITPNVLAAMVAQGERNLALIERGVPWVARGIFRNFAGVEGTHIYNMLAEGKLTYLHLVMRRN